MQITIIIVYLVAIFAVGMWCNRYNNNVSDYLLAGRRLGVGLTTFTLVATYFGGGYVIGVGGEAYSSGLSAYWSPVAGAVGILAVCLILSKMEGMKVYTVTEIMEVRYKSPLLRLLTTLLSLCALIGILAGQVTSAGSVLASLGIGNMTICAIIVAAFFIGFTAFGGLWAVTVTDFIQIIVAGAGLIIATIYIIHVGGGWDVISAKINNAGINSHYFSLLKGVAPSYVLWLILPMFIYTLIGQDVYQRLFAAKSTKTARISAILACLILMGICIFPVILGMVARGLFPDIKQSSLVIPTIINTMMPPALAGLTLAAIIAAVVSTADSILTAATSHLVNDLYVRYSKKYDGMDDEKNAKSILRVSRVATLLVGIFSVVIALAVPSVLQILNDSYILFTAGVFAPVVVGLLWKKATKAGAFAGLISGLGFVVLGNLGVSLFGIPTDIASSLLAVVVSIIVSFITYRPGSETDILANKEDSNGN
jgi:SSS family solute:Na+ symporter